MALQVQRILRQGLPSVAGGVSAEQRKKKQSSLQRIVENSEAPAVLAYSDGLPVGWCALAPKDSLSPNHLR
jgi:hypothetical protein